MAQTSDNYTPYTSSQIAESSSYGGVYYEVRNGWIALYDYNTACTYYQNLTSKTTQWEKPPEWDSTYPGYLTSEQYSAYYYATGTEEAPQKAEPTAEEKHRKTNEDIIASNKKYLSRPAPRQVDPEEKKKIHWRPEGVGEYNIWYDKWVGEHWNSKDKGPAETRCELAKDSGYTKASIYEPSAQKHYFCIHFARGACHLGPECGYLHLLPTDNDERSMDLAHDVFGRERHRLHRDDMGGTGSIEKGCKTLYVGGLSNRNNTEDILWEDFSEWGEVEEIRKIPSKNIAFVRYKNRVNAEFAKVAMSDQMLRGREILNVRWAYDDPNPAAKKKILRRAQIEMLSAADDLGLLDTPAAKKLRPYREEYVTGDYPNTDDQYPDTVQPPAVGPLTREMIEKVDSEKRAADDWSRLDGVFKQMESIKEHESVSVEQNDLLESEKVHDKSVTQHSQQNKQTHDPYRSQNV